MSERIHIYFELFINRNIQTVGELHLGFWDTGPACGQVRPYFLGKVWHLFVVMFNLPMIDKLVQALCQKCNISKSTESVCWHSELDIFFFFCGVTYHSSRYIMCAM